MYRPHFTAEDRLAILTEEVSESGYFVKSNPRARRQPKKRVRQATRQVCRTSRWTRYA